VSRAHASGETEEVEEIEPVEVLDAIPVLSQEPSRALVAAVAPSVRTAAVAAGGFVAGAAMVGLVHRRSRPAPAKRRRAARGLGKGRRRGRGRASELVEIVGTRSLLLDVHLLGGGDR
jgi:hypothetical protein